MSTTLPDRQSSRLSEADKAVMIERIQQTLATWIPGATETRTVSRLVEWVPSIARIAFGGIGCGWHDMRDTEIAWCWDRILIEWCQFLFPHDAPVLALPVRTVAAMNAQATYYFGEGLEAFAQRMRNAEETVARGEACPCCDAAWGPSEIGWVHHEIVHHVACPLVAARELADRR